MQKRVFGKRAYVSDEVNTRVDKYRRAKGIQIKEAYEEIIRGTLDENGNPRAGIILTETQIKAIEQIAGDMDQSLVKTAQDLINFALLVFGTNVPLNIALMRAVPVMMDEMVEIKPDIAKEILRGLRSDANAVKLNPQAALRYED